MTDTPVTTTNSPMLSDKTYDLLNKLVQIVLPAFATLYFGMAALWGLPSAEQVVATSALVATFLGTLLRISNRSYKGSSEGDMVVSTGPEGNILYSFELNDDIDTLQNKGQLRFNVKTL